MKLFETEQDRDHALLHLIAATSLILFALFLIMEDLQRLKRITSPRLVFVAPRIETPAPAMEGPALEGAAELLN